MLNNKVALITGASSGIGKSTAVHFVELGASVSLTGRNKANLEETAKLCNAASTGDQKVFTYVADLSREDETNRVVEETLKNFKQLDILVNNAGVQEIGSIENTTLEQYDRVFNVNVRSVYHLTMLAVPHLIKTKGNIVNVSSVTGSRAFPGILSYCMSKSAINQFSNCIALELASKGVRVNSVNPGVIETELQRRGGLDDEAYKKFLERCKDSHPLGRVGQPVEVAHAIAFLATDQQSTFITGIQLPVDGGRQAVCPR